METKKQFSDLTSQIGENKHYNIEINKSGQGVVNSVAVSVLEFEMAKIAERIARGHEIYLRNNDKK